MIILRNKATAYEPMQQPKKEKKCKQNSYEEIRKLVDEGEEMKLKETINTKRGEKNNEHDFKFRLNLFD